MIVEARMVEAYKAGGVAAQTRKPWNANPYNGIAATAVERVLAIAWRRGYSANIVAGGASKRDA